MFLLEPDLQTLHLNFQLQFPSLLLAQLPEGLSAQPENARLRSTLERLADEELGMPVLEWLEGIQVALANRGQDMNHFFTTNFSYPEVLCQLVPLTAAKGDLSCWFDLLQDKSEAEFRRALILAAWPDQRLFELDLVDEQEKSLHFTDPDQLCVYLEADPFAISAYLRQAGLNAGDAWTLQSLIEKPKTALQAFIALVQSFEFVSEAIVGSIESEAIRCLAENLAYLETKLSYASQDQLKGQEEQVLVWPSLQPFELRQDSNARKLYLGFALPLYFQALEELEAVEREENNAFCQTLADPTRYKICCLLAQGPQKQKDLAESLQVSQATVSHHISQLKECGLIAEDKNGGLMVDVIRQKLNGVARDLRIYG
ncbi:MAG: winged helix-turn-helix domain-containing protein [Eubacteriales bacterium]|nr:winged helix-turn-helix domain-containing protein [Eubacteriales bacterium]